MNYYVALKFEFPESIEIDYRQLCNGSNRCRPTPIWLIIACRFVVPFYFSVGSQFLRIQSHTHAITTVQPTEKKKRGRCRRRQRPGIRVNDERGPKLDHRGPELGGARRWSHNAPHEHTLRATLVLPRGDWW